MNQSAGRPVGHREPEGFDHRRLARNPIAIVGMSGLFPMARNHHEYWQNVVDGTDCTVEVPASRWSLDDYYDADPATPDKTYSRRGAFIPDVEFSPLEFGLPPNQLEVTSTMQTLSLGVARDVLRDAGAVSPGAVSPGAVAAEATTAEWYDPSRTGVVLGTTGPVPLMHPLAARLSTPVLREVVRSCGLAEADADAVAAKYVQAFAPWEENSFPGLLANVVAGRVANRLGLGGMNTTVDAACAASLSAVRLAVAELVDGRADTMITGGVDTENTIFIYMCFSKVQALSKSGTISPFSDAADGTLLGEGIGMLALRRLADAERDGNRVYAVIRGIGSSSDGRSKSIYAPRAEGQRVALDRAYADADCSPASVELFEAHATGTAVGDRTELTALGGLLRDASDERHFAALGSVKSQIGHTKGAAGTASLMKLALGLYHKVLPPTINVDRPSQAVDFDDAPYYVNVTNRPWIRDPHRPVRRAAASAMGFGGTNFHVVLEEHSGVRSTVRTLHRAARAYLWHAPDASALLDLLVSGAAASDGPIPTQAARVGFVAADDETAEELRELAITQLTRDAAADHWSHPRGVYFRARGRENPRIAALFAGQGSQYLDMGIEAAISVPPVGAAFDEANAAFDGAARRLAPVVFPPPVFDARPRQAQEAALRATEYAQPAIGALSVGQFRYLSELGLSCSGYLGHSFGELTALHAAGALEAEGYFRLARERGLAMAAPGNAGDVGNAHDRGAMAAVPADRKRVSAMLAELADVPGVVVCNHNAPDQVVVGGGTAEVEAFVQHCADQGLVARLLPVSAAFHTRYVAHAEQRFADALDRVPVGEPKAPVYANTQDVKYGPDGAANARALARQLLEPVEFVAAVEAAHAAGCDVFVEFGPKQVLTQLVRRILHAADVVAVATDAGPLGNSDVALKQAAVQLAVLGAPLSGINRHQAAVVEEVPARGATVTLSAPEYVPPGRREAYQAALSDGYHVRPSPAAGASASEPVDGRASRADAADANGGTRNSSSDRTAANGHREPGPVGSAPGGSVALSAPLFEEVAVMRDDVRADLVTQHVDLHGTYLSGQLAVANQLVEILRDHQLHGREQPELHHAVALVAQQSVAIGQAHTAANEVLARLADLEVAAVGPAGYRPLASPPVTSPPALSPSVSNGRLAPSPPRQPAVHVLPAQPPPAPVPSPPPAPLAAPAEPAPTVVPAAPAVAVPERDGLFDVASVRAALVEVVADKTGYAADMIDTGMDLEADLGVDSIKRVQVLGALRERYPQAPTVGPEQLAELRTLDQIAAFVTAEAGGADPKVGKSVAVREAAPRRVVRLVRLPDVDRLDAPYADEPVAVVLHSGSADGELVAAGFEARGWNVRRVDLGEPTPAGPFTEKATAVERRLARALKGRVDLCLTVLGSGNVDAGGDLESWDCAVRRLAETVLVAKHAYGPLVETAAAGTRAAFVTLTRLDGGLGHRGRAGIATAVLGGVGGVVKTLAAEAPTLFCRAVDVSPELAATEVVDLLDAEIRDAARDTPEVGVDERRHRTTVVPGSFDPLADAGEQVAGAGLAGADLAGADLAGTDLDGAELTVGPDDVFVVSGGGRGVTALCVRALAEHAPARFVLLGRSPLADEPAWAADVADAELKAAVIAQLRAEGGRPAPRQVEAGYRELLAQREIRATLAAVGAAGARADYVTVDVTDPVALRAALDGYRGRVTGLVHGAGVLADALLPDKTARDVYRVFAAKLNGLRGLLDAIVPLDPGDDGSAGASLRHLVLFTSVAGLLGNPGQADYAAANEALCRVAASVKREAPDCHVTALDWGAWDGGMVTPELRELFRTRGVALLDPVAGATAFVDTFRRRHADEVCVLVGPCQSLAGQRPGVVPAFVARRQVADVAGHPVIQAHRVGGFEVLPATFGLGLLVNVVERAHPGTAVVDVQDFAVHKGIVFDGTPLAPCQVHVEPVSVDEAGRLVVRASVSSDGGRLRVSHYAATLVLAAAPPAAPKLADWPGYRPDVGPENGQAIYQEGTQFHGPRLQGMRRVLANDRGRLVLECRLDDDPGLRSAFGGTWHSPVLADVLLQGPPVLGKALLGQACLPLGVRRAEYFGPLPDGSPFFLVVDGAVVDDGGTGASATATACDADGVVLQRFTGVAVVATPDLSAKFAESVRHWRVTENDDENEDTRT